MYATIRNMRRLHLPIDLQLSIFDTIVRPIMLYGSEVWGFEKNDILDKLGQHLKKIQMILCLNKSTPNVMVYGESGRHPILLEMKQRMVTL